MTLTHTQTKERAELIALSIGKIQLDRELLSDMIWRKLGSNAYLQFLIGAPEIELSLRLLVDGEVAKIREYTESDLDETCLLSHIQIRPQKRHLSWRPVVTLVQNIDDVSATAVGDTGDMADRSYLGRGISLSLTETGLVARPDSIGLSGQVWVRAQLTDHWMTASSGDPYVNLTLECFYGMRHTNSVSNNILVTRGQLANRLESYVLKLLQEQGKYQLTRIGMLP